MQLLRTATGPLLVALVLAGCGGDDTADAPAPTPAATDATTTVAPAPGPTTAPSESTSTSTGPSNGTGPSTSDEPEATVPDQRVQAAIADLAAGAGRSPDAITVGRVEEVTWRDGSIGCPEPGRSYTQALVPGYRIELVLDGATVWYHGARDGAPFRCDTPSDPVEGAVGDR